MTNPWAGLVAYRSIVAAQGTMSHSHTKNGTVPPDSVCRRELERAMVTDLCAFNNFVNTSEKKDRANAASPPNYDTTCPRAPSGS
jgi:hypothetical protein